MRTVIVGDVHGCKNELETLLDAVAFTTGDRLIFVGDLVARGPDSLGVLDVARRTGAIVVRGNHEQRLLDAHRAPGGRPLGRLHRALSRSLRAVDWRLLQTSPLWLDLPEHGLRVVHAGVVPGLAIEAHTPTTLMSLRSVRPAGRRFREVGPGERGRDTRLWGACYAGPPHVVFGHNAAPGLQIHPWATGLDTGCVYGGRLTALVLDADQKVPRGGAARRALLRHVQAERVWFDPFRRPGDARRRVA